MARFVMMNLDDEFKSEGAEFREHEWTTRLTLEDKWILSRLNRVIKIVDEGFSKYDMDDAARSLYEFLWSEFADWYVELAKPRLRTEERGHVQYMLWHVLETSMRLLHPIMPFITEEIWHALPHGGESIMIAPFPVVDEALIDDASEEEMSFRIETMRRARELKARERIPLKKSSRIYLTPPPGSQYETYSNRLMQDRKFTEATSGTAVAGVYPGGTPPVSEPLVVTYAPGATGVHLQTTVEDREKVLQDIDAELATTEKELARVTGKLSNEQFTSKAPAEVVQKERRIQGELQDRKMRLEERKKSC
jgi:valyl-tRNA synthetase